MAEFVEFNDIAQRAKVAAGYKGGNYFMNPVKVPARHFVAAESLEAQMPEGLAAEAKMTVTDPWYTRKQGN